MKAIQVLPLALPLALFFGCDASRSTSPGPPISDLGTGGDTGRPDAAPQVPDAAPQVPDAGPDVRIPPDIAVLPPLDAAPLPDAANTPDAATDDFEALMAAGLQLLADARTREARTPFAAAHALRPDDTNAAFALALAQTIDALELAGMLLTLPGQVAHISRNEEVAEAIHGELVHIRDEVAAALDLTAGVDPAGLHLTVDAAWVYLTVEPIVVYRGTFDAGDFHLYRASASFLVGLFDLLAGNDLRTDLFGLINGGLSSLGFDFRSLGALLGTLLTADGGHFLEVHPVAGPDLWLDSQQRLSAVGAELQLALDAMAAEPAAGGDGEGEVSWVTPLPAGSGYTLHVANFVTQDDDFNLTEAPYEIPLDNTLMAAFQHASRAIVTPDEVVDFQNEFLPILSVIVHVAAKTHVLDSLLGSLPINLGALPRPGLEAVLKTLLPLPMGMAPGSLYAGEPVGLRIILPRVADTEPARFVAEWECPEALDADGVPPGGGFLCPEDAPLTDAPHFDGALEADGLATRGPYLRFADATMSGLARVDLSALGVPGWEAAGWQVPDERALAAALATSLPPLLGLMGGL